MESLDQLFIFLVFICASGVVVIASFFLMLLFVAVTEGKQAAIKIFHDEW